MGGSKNAMERATVGPCRKNVIFFIFIFQKPQWEGHSRSLPYTGCVICM
jgi:hypothetical protein